MAWVLLMKIHPMNWVPNPFHESPWVSAQPNIASWWLFCLISIFSAVEHCDAILLFVVRDVRYPWQRIRNTISMYLINKVAIYLLISKCWNHAVSEWRWSRKPWVTCPVQTAACVLSGASRENLIVVVREFACWNAPRFPSREPRSSLLILEPRGQWKCVGAIAHLGEMYILTLDARLYVQVDRDAYRSPVRTS